MVKSRSYIQGIILALVAGILWGMTGPIGQFLFDDKLIPPVWLVSYRMLLSGILMLVWFGIKKGKNELFSIWKTKKDAVDMILYSVLGMMTVQYSFFAAVAASNGGTATVLQYTNPVMMIFYFAVFYKIKPSRKDVMAVLLALAGIFFLSTNGNINSLIITPMGLFLGLLCAFFTCIYSILPKNLLEKYDTTMVCGWAMLLGGVVLFLYGQPWTLNVETDIAVWGLFILLVIGGTIIPFVASLNAIKLIGPIYTNVLSTLEPVVASILTFLLLGTSFGKIEIVGFILIIVTIILLAIKKE